MAALVCDVCGGKLVMGTGGIATCDICGIEYSTERLREMLQALRSGEAGSTPFSAPAPAPAAADNTSVIANYLNLAESALQNSNHEEAESYANRTLELEPNNHKAWYIKGCAAGWQSTLKNLRLSECVSAFARAVQNAPENEKTAMSRMAKMQFITVCKAIAATCASNFENWPDANNANDFDAKILAVCSAIAQMISAAHITIEPRELMEPIADMASKAAADAFNGITFREYSKTTNDPDFKTTKLDWEKYIVRIDSCCALLLVAVSQYDKASSAKIPIYKNLIQLHNAAISSCSWKWTINSAGIKQWSKEWMLSESAKRARRSLITEYENAIRSVKDEQDKLQRAAEKERAEAYWELHAEEKAALEAEKAELEKQIADLKAQAAAAAASAEPEINDIRTSIKSMMHDMDGLGMFKAKEKKALQEKIDAAYADIQAVKDAAEAKRKEISKSIPPLEDRLNEIRSELNKVV